MLKFKKLRKTPYSRKNNIKTYKAEGGLRKDKIIKSYCHSKKNIFPTNWLIGKSPIIFFKKKHLILK